MQNSEQFYSSLESVEQAYTPILTKHLKNVLSSLLEYKTKLLKKLTMQKSNRIEQSSINVTRQQQEVVERFWKNSMLAKIYRSQNYK